jgi:hypothetical protein
MNIHISVPFLCTNNEQAEKTILFIVVNKKAGLLDPCYHETEVFFRNHVHLTNHLLWKEPHSLAQLVGRLNPPGRNWWLNKQRESFTSACGDRPEH